MDDNAQIQNQWFGKTVILSDHRFTYEEAQTIIETGEGILKDEILTLDRLAKELRKERFKKGSIGFEKAEVRKMLVHSCSILSLQRLRPYGYWMRTSADFSITLIMSG